MEPQRIAALLVGGVPLVAQDPTMAQSFLAKEKAPPARWRGTEQKVDPSYTK